MDEKLIDLNTSDKLTEIADISRKLHWSNSSNVLCNYMKKSEYLELVLKNKAIIPRYVIEPLDYLQLDKITQICFPMTCFCDIPFSKVSTHMTNYGEYGIGLDKEAVLDKYAVQPIHYMNEKSPLINDFREAFNRSLDKKAGKSDEVLAGYLVSTLLYMKPIWGWNKDNNKSYIYQDECEWRYIPSDKFPKNLHLVLRPSETTEKGKEEYSKALQNHSECWLKFEWDDVRYIIVPDDLSARNVINTIRQLNIDRDEQDMLIAKIEISRRFADNM